MDYYGALGVKPTATQAEIKSAFRTLVKSLHPDANPPEGSEDRLQAVIAAHEVLGNPSRRKLYDQTRAHQAQTATQERKPQPPPGQRVQDQKAKQEWLDHRKKSEELATLVRTGRVAEAEDLAKQLTKVKFNDPFAHSVIADMARLRGEYTLAAKHYAYAAQYDPTNTIYQRKHEETLAAIDLAKSGVARDAGERSPTAVLIGVFVVILAAAYTGLAPEQPIAPAFVLASTWTIGQIVMSLLAGVALGACLSAGDVLDHLDLGGTAVVARVHPGLALSLVAIVNFWVALALYVLVGATQRAFNTSVSRLMAGSVVTVVAFVLARIGSGGLAVAQTLAWIGNLVFVGGCCGWFVADSLRVSGTSRR